MYKLAYPKLTIRNKPTPPPSKKIIQTEETKWQQNICQFSKLEQLEQSCTRPWVGTIRNKVTSYSSGMTCYTQKA